MRLRLLSAVLATTAVTLGMLPAGAAEPGSGGAEPAAAATGRALAAEGTGLLPSFGRPGSDLVRLQVGAFDPLADALPTQPGVAAVAESSLDPATAYPWLVQVRDRRYTEALRSIAQSGATVLEVVPESTYVVRATPAQRLALAASPAVRWSGYYQPAYKLPVAAAGKKGILELPGRQVYRVRGFPALRGAVALGSTLDRLDGVTVLDDAGIVVDVAATSRELPAIARLGDVAYVGVRPRVVLHNANARWVTDTGIRDVLAATRPDRLTGAGQTAGVADTGLNYYPDLNDRAHRAFSDCSSDLLPETAQPANRTCKLADYTQKTPGNSTTPVDPENPRTAPLFEITASNGTSPHRKMAGYFDIAGASTSPRDDSAHGSHVAGSVTADYGANKTPEGHDGMAPGARLVFQSIGTTSGGLSTPSDDYQLFRQAYRPRDPVGVPTSYDAADYNNYRPNEDARTHNNSYGLIAPIIDEGSADALDEFVWEHEDMVIVVSAGNAGPDAGSIGSPSVAKNNLSSAASANGRQPMVSIDSLASFSSHGPTGDGRLGPDVATPGQIVVSTKGGSAGDDHYLQGTSMSAPVLTGNATIVRQYFYDGYGPGATGGIAVGSAAAARRHNPSAALVKATIVNGAVRMRGWYTGDDGTQRSMDGQWPSGGQGFGLVNLDNSLYFSGDPLTTWYEDVWRASDKAFGVGGGDVREYKIGVAAGAPLDLTMAYTDAPTGLPAGTPATVNNLDLEVVGPDGTVYVGNNMNTRSSASADVGETSGGDAPPDTKNLVERVRVAEPAAGEWTVRVRGSYILEGPQGYALAGSGRLSAPGGTPPTGAPILRDAPGAPTVSNVAVRRVSADTSMLTFTTNEPTTATATLTSAGTEAKTFADVYNHANGSPFTTYYKTGQVETSADYADRKVVGTRHEILLFGLAAGRTYSTRIEVSDLATTPGKGTATSSFTSPATAFQPFASDIGQLANIADLPVDPVSGTSGWRTATQLYSGPSSAAPPSRYLSAFMFRLPESVDPAKIRGARVELTSGHIVTSMYDTDPRLAIDLLNPAVEPGWGTQDYQAIKNAPADARVRAEAAKLVGNQRYSFTFACSDLAKLKETLTEPVDGERRAAFRYENLVDASDSLVSFEFGFNRRSRGPDLRPRLVLDTDTSGDPGPCDATAPAPRITELGVANGATEKSVSVSWRTDVPSNSTVLFRERGAAAFTQVVNHGLTTVHEVQVLGLDPAKRYEFGVRSTGCNGRTTTADNAGAGYHFFLPPEPPRTGTDYFFHGQDSDQFNKLSGSPTATFDTTAPTGSATKTQTSSSLNVPTVPYDPAAAYWEGPFKGTINNDVELSLYVTTANAGAAVTPPDVDITFFADPENNGEDQAAKVIGHVLVELDPGTTTPVLNTVTVPVSGTVAERLQISINPYYVDTGQDIRFSYDSESAPAKFKVLDPLPPRTGPVIPRVGPKPPPSAGASGLNLAAVPARAEPTAADIAAGSGCGVSPAAGATPAAVSIGVNVQRITAGNKPVLSGVVRDASGKPVPNAAVTVYEKRYNTTSYVQFASVTADATGTWKQVIAPERQTAYIARSGAAQSSALLEFVHNRVNIAAPVGGAQLPRSTVVRGDLDPNFASIPVGVAILRNGRYTFLTKGNTNGRGEFAIPVNLPPGRYALVVYTSARQGTDRGSASRAVVVR